MMQQRVATFSDVRQRVANAFANERARQLSIFTSIGVPLAAHSLPEPYFSSQRSDFLYVYSQKCQYMFSYIGIFLFFPLILCLFSLLKHSSGTPIDSKDNRWRPFLLAKYF
ncbi:MAG: hypothetical protein ACI4WY_06260 [Anaerovoracaceae bacterium]